MSNPQSDYTKSLLAAAPKPPERRHLNEENDPENTNADAVALHA